jgi:hypothetical protein
MRCQTAVLVGRLAALPPNMLAAAPAAFSLTSDGCPMTGSCSMAWQTGCEQLPGRDGHTCTAAAPPSMAACNTKQQQQQCVKALAFYAMCAQGDISLPWQDLTWQLCC